MSLGGTRRGKAEPCTGDLRGSEPCTALFEDHLCSTSAQDAPPLHCWHHGLALPLPTKVVPSTSTSSTCRSTSPQRYSEAQTHQTQAQTQAHRGILKHKHKPTELSSSPAHQQSPVPSLVLALRVTFRFPRCAWSVTACKGIEPPGSQIAHVQTLAFDRAALFDDMNAGGAT